MEGSYYKYRAYIADDFSASQVASAFDRDFSLHRPGHQVLQCITMPNQAVRLHLEAVAVQACMAYAAQTRAPLQGVGDIAREVLRSAKKGRSDEDARILDHCLFLASWSNAKQ